MHETKGWQQEFLSFIRPDDLIGAFIYLVVFIAIAVLLSRGLRAAVHTALSKDAHIDRTAINFMQQIGSVLIWLMAIIQACDQGGSGGGGGGRRQQLFVDESGCDRGAAGFEISGI